MKQYLAFGLRISSEVELGSLTRANAALEAKGLPDVTVRLGSGSDAAARPPLESDGWFEFDGDRHRFGWSELGVVEIVSGKLVTIWPKHDVAAGLVEHVLLGPVLADILLTRGSLPLHASANRVGDGLVAFVGQSGRGKSTLAAALHAAGRSSYGDDLIAVPCDGVPIVHFGISRIKLNEDSATATGADPSVLPQVYAGIDKRSKPVVRPADDRALPLLAIYRIVESDELGIVAVRPERALFELLSNCFRVEVEQHARGIRELMERCGKVLDHVPLFELRRPRDFSRLGQVVAMVQGHAESLQHAPAT